MTRFQVLERSGNYTLVELQLETGRTHQIPYGSYWPSSSWRPCYGPKKTLKGQGQFPFMRGHLVSPTLAQERLWNLLVEVPAIFEKTLEDLKSDVENG